MAPGRRSRGRVVGYARRFGGYITPENVAAAAAAGSQMLQAWRKRKHAPRALTYLSGMANPSLDVVTTSNGPNAPVRTTTRRKKRKVKKTLKGRMRKMEKKVGKLIQKQKYFVYSYYQSSAAQRTSAVNSCSYTQNAFPNQSDMMTYADTYLKTIGNDDANSTTRVETLQTSDLGADVSTSFTIYDYVFFLHLRNNSYAPCRCNATWVKCVQDCESNPMTEWQKDSENKNGGTGLTTDPHFYFSSFQTPSWKSYKSCSFVLNPGDEIRLMVKIPTYTFNYNREFDTALAFMKGFSRAIIVRQQGTIGHVSTTQANIGYTNTIIDSIWTRRFKFKSPSPIAAVGTSSNFSLSTGIDTIMDQSVDKESTTTN